jgi:hypothetical protein
MFCFTRINNITIHTFKRGTLQYAESVREETCFEEDTGSLTCSKFLSTVLLLLTLFMIFFFSLIFFTNGDKFYDEDDDDVNN